MNETYIVIYILILQTLLKYQVVFLVFQIENFVCIFDRYYTNFNFRVKKYYVAVIKGRFFSVEQLTC